MDLTDILSLAGIPSIIAFLFQLAFNAYNERKRKKRQDGKVEREALQALLRDRLQEQHRYFIRQGYCSLQDKNNVSNVYRCYHQLGQNGVMTSAYEDIMNLPTEAPNDK